MMKRRTVLSDIVITAAEPQPQPGATSEVTEPRRRARPDTIQQTLYLSPSVHDQLRELAFSERVKMHAIIMEGLDAVFRARGLKSIADLTGKP